MHFIFALNHSDYSRWTRDCEPSTAAAYSREQCKFHGVGGLGRILLVLCGCPSEVCERAETTGLWPTVITGARPARE